MTAEAPLAGVRLERWMTLERGTRHVRIRHRLTCIGERAVDYIWKFHPALRIEKGDRLLVPATRGCLVPGSTGRLAEGPADFDWPMAPGRQGGPVDLSVIPDMEAMSDRPDGYEMACLTGLRAGWCALLDPQNGCGLGLAFDRELFLSVWLFQTLGGWQGLRTAVMEPATAPCDLPEAATAGDARRLEPGQVLETVTAAVLIRDRFSVEHIDTNGAVS